MSVLFIDSFDDRDTAHLKEKAVGDYADGEIVVGCGQCGTNGFRDPSIGDGIRYGYTNFSDQMQIGVALYNDTVSGASASILVKTGNVAKAFWQLENTDEVHFWTGPNGILGTDHGFGTAPVGAWTYIELQVFFHDTLGTVKGYINGTQVVDVSNFDTIDFWSGTEQAGAASLHCTVGAGQGCMDDFYVMNGDGAAPNNATVPIGPAHVIAMTPYDDGDARGWVPSSGSDNFAMVDEVPPDDGTTYVASSQEGAQDLYEFLDVVLPSETVYAVQRGFHVTSTTTKHSEVSHIDKAAGVQRETERWGIQYPDQFYNTQIDDDQPNGSAWNLTAFNRAQFGMKHYTSKSTSVGFPA